ncbi:uncharacterized protein N7482_009789 [Penicillium canariense]|uniref:Uncharacterized protein n=1 Tax=Penicillium canariense TaxID=189055 RepID=A0A9W9HPE9_9EURO|nr:uncharacterized protein N7482_009789 [Penicillium canariense]KAJ5153311.1 hypothetical protein N7482_009789 [Penicillium canariense]
MVNTSMSSDFTVDEITQAGRKGRTHGHKYDGADYDPESMILTMSSPISCLCLMLFMPGIPANV